MSIDFFATGCQSFSSKKLFGLYDDPHPAQNPAYILEEDGAKWIAVVVNDERHEVTFTAIDHCIETPTRPDGTMDNRCDGVLAFNNTVIFVELKDRADRKGSEWVKDAEQQLRATIVHFEQQDDAENFEDKKAYIANAAHPRFRESQVRRMDQFFTDTGYVLRVQNRIVLD